MYILCPNLIPNFIIPFGAATLSEIKTNNLTENNIVLNFACLWILCKWIICTVYDLHYISEWPNLLNIRVIHSVYSNNISLYTYITYWYRYFILSSHCNFNLHLSDYSWSWLSLIQAQYTLLKMTGMKNVSNFGYFHILESGIWTRYLEDRIQD